MPGSADEADAAEAEYRPLLFPIACGMTGSVGDAGDSVQDAFPGLTRARGGEHDHRSEGVPDPSDSQSNPDLRKITRNLSLTFAAFGDTGCLVQLNSSTTPPASGASKN